MSHSIISDVMAAADPNFKVHSVDEVRAAVNNAVALAGPDRQAIAGQREQVLQDRSESISLAGSVASMDAAEKPVQPVIPEAPCKTVSASLEADAQGPDIGM